MKLNKSLTTFRAASFKTWIQMLLLWTSYTIISSMKVTRGPSQGLWIDFSRIYCYILTWNRSAQRMPYTLSVTSSLVWEATQEWGPWVLTWGRDWRQVLVSQLVSCYVYTYTCSFVGLTLMVVGNALYPGRVAVDLTFAHSEIRSPCVASNLCHGLWFLNGFHQLWPSTNGITTWLILSVYIDTMISSSKTFRPWRSSTVTKLFCNLVKRRWLTSALSFHCCVGSSVQRWVAFLFLAICIIPARWN